MTIDCPTCKAIALAHKMDAEDGGYPPIDNHPLTPKPVDDREKGVGDHQMYVAHADSIAARQIAQWAERAGQRNDNLG